MNKFTDISKIKRDELLALPQKDFTKIETYESIIIVPTRKKHESGWRLMAIVGCKCIDGTHNIPCEIAGYCDDLEFNIKNRDYFAKLDYIPSLYSCDMLLSNCIRFHSNICHFEIGMCCSSTDVELIVDKEKYMKK